MVFEKPMLGRPPSSQMRIKRDGSGLKIGAKAYGNTETDGNQKAATKSVAFDRKTQMHCALTCFGTWCAHEQWTNCPTQPPAIRGLHSEWVMDLIVGS